jgi:thiosulfate dehydrogenase [quinone] large subunit
VGWPTYDQLEGENQMSTQRSTVEANLLGTNVSLGFSKPWASYWLFFLRVMTGWWFMHAGLTKLMENGLMMPEGGLTWFIGAGGLPVSPIMGLFQSGIALDFVRLMVPVGEFLIGLGLIVGCMLRLAAFFGGFLMTFFYFVNHGWGHGMFSSDMMGLLLFITVALFGAGRVWGLDAYLEQTDWVKRNSWAKYLLG